MCVCPWVCRGYVCISMHMCIHGCLCGRSQISIPGCRCLNGAGTANALPPDMDGTLFLPHHYTRHFPPNHCGGGSSALGNPLNITEAEYTSFVVHAKRESEEAGAITRDPQRGLANLTALFQPGGPMHASTMDCLLP